MTVSSPVFWVQTGPHLMTSGSSLDPQSDLSHGDSSVVPGTAQPFEGPTSGGRGWDGSHANADRAYWLLPVGRREAPGERQAIRSLPLAVRRTDPTGQSDSGAADVGRRDWARSRIGPDPAWAATGTRTGRVGSRGHRAGELKITYDASAGSNPSSPRPPSRSSLRPASSVSRFPGGAHAKTSDASSKSNEITRAG
jgi:hypothetical protein